MQTHIRVTASVGGRTLDIGRYADPAIAAAVAESWARWPGCRCATVRPAGDPPIVFLRHLRLISSPPRPEVPPAA